MRYTKILLLTFAFLLSSSPVLLASTSFGSAGACSITILHENVSDNAIQTAINNAELGVTGPIICIAGGTYPEQLLITNNNIQLIGKGTPLNPTMIQPTTLSSNAADFDNSNLPIAAIIVAKGTASSSISGIAIRNIVVDGTLGSPSIAGCGEDYIGILFQEASGTITNDKVNGLYLPPGLGGCQTGLGVYVATGSGQTSTVSISSNVVTNYQKNGITCNDAGTKCTITQNKVSFYTPYAPFIAPNGIQIGFGAWGKVSQNTVSNNVCTLSGACGSNLITQAQGTGILTFESAAGTIVTGNKLTGNDIGVGTYFDASKLIVKSNVIKSSTFAGIVQYDGNYVATDNTLTNNPLGIAVISDGAGPYPATASNNALSSISGNRISGQTYSVQIQTVSPGSAIVTYNGHTYSVVGSSTINIH